MSENRLNHKKSYKSSDFEIFRERMLEPGSIWLDSTMTFGDRGNNSFLFEYPVGELILLPPQTKMLPSCKQSLMFSDPELFYGKIDRIAAEGAFTLAGYISYEAMHWFLDLTPKTFMDGLPLAHFYIYREHTDSHYPGDMKSKNCQSTSFDEHDITDIISFEPYAQYEHKIRQIKHHIHEGDIYQANYTTRSSFKSSMNSFEAYTKLRSMNQSPYGGFMNFGPYKILSSSPERMFYRRGDKITSSPIKGTIGRGMTPEEETANRDRLLQSEKDKAELLMIVDLVRNDLGKIAKTGSVHVDELFKTETYRSLIHLVADISAELRPEVGYYDIFKALLPGGSITGAPKKRAVEIIREYEKQPRFVYTGIMGYINGDTADFNIAIRTMYHRDETYHIHAGGGIVADSEASGEYREMLLKAERLLHIFETTYASEKV